MARELNQAVADLYRATYSYSSGVQYTSGRRCTFNNKMVYMEIPINEDIFEMPVFAFITFMDVVKKDPETDAIIAKLETYDKVPEYKTISRYMRDILNNNYKRNKLIKLTTKGIVSDTFHTYYATQGAIFDDNFSPIMMCSWQIQKPKEEGGKYNFLRPILRIDPKCYLYRETEMEKFIVNKLSLVSLDSTIYRPNNPNVVELFTVPEDNPGGEIAAELKIEVDKCPFSIKGVDKPSISTTNEELLKLAIDHIDELTDDN